MGAEESAASSPSTEHIVAQEERGSDCDSSTHIQRLCHVTLSHQGLYWKSLLFISVWKLFANRKNYIYTYILYVCVCGGLVDKSCLTLATPWTVCSLSVSSLHGTSQAGILEWVAISFSMYMCMCVCIYIYIHTSICTYLCVCVYIYTCGKIPWRRKWQPTPVLLPRKFHGWRSLVGYSPWGLKESDTTERLHFPFHVCVLSCV